LHFAFAVFHNRANDKGYSFFSGLILQINLESSSIIRKKMNSKFSFSLLINLLSKYKLAEISSLGIGPDTFASSKPEGPVRKK
jgi:hypothetical protein